MKTPFSFTPLIAALVGGFNRLTTGAGRTMPAAAAALAGPNYAPGGRALSAWRQETRPPQGWRQEQSRRRHREIMRRRRRNASI